MLDFYTPTLEDKQWVSQLVKNSGQIGCDLSFATMYLWRDKYDIRIARYDDVLFKAYFYKGNIGYTFPIGAKKDKKAIDVILADAQLKGVRPLIGMLSETNAEILSRLYPGCFDIVEERDSADYIHSRYNLALLPGKKFHAKRNHISKFLRTYANYSLKELNETNLEDAYFVAYKWQQINNGDESELFAIREALDNLSSLDMFGLLLYVDNSPVAMTIASKINDSVCDVNFEKAIVLNGAYAMINNAFAKLHTQFEFFNREEDMGIEGLRKSKLSYYPDILLKKYTAIMK